MSKQALAWQVKQEKTRGKVLSQVQRLELFQGFSECSKQTVFTTTVVIFFRRGHNYSYFYPHSNQLDPTYSTPLRLHMVRSTQDRPQLAIYTHSHQASSDRRPSTPLCHCLCPRSCSLLTTPPQGTPQGAGQQPSQVEHP